MDRKAIALQRLTMMGDWLKLKGFNQSRLCNELKSFSNSWKAYNPRNKNNRFGLSITSLDGKLSGTPDLDSLYEFNKENNTKYNNQSFRELTRVYNQCPELKEILTPYLPWLGRCHFLRIDRGGFFPEHYDIDKTDYEMDEIRLIGFVRQTDSFQFKFCYEDRLMTNLRDGEFYYFNAHKRHSVFSTTDGVILLVVTLRFDEELFQTLINNYQCK